MILADYLVERARTQEFSEGCRLAQALVDGIVKERRRSLAFGGDAKVKVARLSFADVLRRARHEVIARLGLRERDDLADVLFAREDGDQAVDAESEAGVRRGAVLEGAEQEPEAALRFLVADPERA